MMGWGHAASGLATGAAIAAWALPAADLPVPGGILGAAVLGTVVAGWSLAPDIDHSRACATTAFGPASRPVHHGITKASELFIAATGTKYDEPREHRGLTHTALFAAAVGVALAVLGAAWPTPVTAIVTGLAVAMLTRLGSKPWISTLAGLSATLGLWIALTATDGPGPLPVAFSAALGCLVHCFGDMITRTGVPILAPFVTVRGKRWWNFRPPLLLTFEAGSRFERFLIGVFCTITAAAAITAVIPAG